MPHEIRAEMVANVMSVAEPGKPVDESDTVVILGSTTMEIPVPSEYQGALTSNVVEEGEVGREHDLIAVAGIAVVDIAVVD